MSAAFDLTVIIPTLASADRSTSLRRAIRSILDQDIPCRIVAVVNGDKRHRDIVSTLETTPNVRVLSQTKGNLVQALVTGVEAVDTRFFSVLDDDDMLLRSACRRRVEYMAVHPEVDVLVTPGEKRHLDGQVHFIPNFSTLDKSDLVASLLRSNWLASCGGVFRRSRIGPDYFEAMPRYLEWTYLAFQLANDCQVHFLEPDEPPHYTIFETESSESRELEYVFAMPASMALLRESPLPRHIERLVSEKLARVSHSAARQALANDMLTTAWKFHIDSLRERHGLRYLSFTRHLLLAGFRAIKAQL